MALREAVAMAAEGHAAGACAKFDQVAQDAAEPLILDVPTVLAIHQPWFDVSPEALTRDLLDRGFMACWFDPEEPLVPRSMEGMKALAPMTIPSCASCATAMSPSGRWRATTSACAMSSRYRKRRRAWTTTAMPCGSSTPAHAG